MRILLIDPPYERLIGFKSEWFPLGIAYIASYMIKQGHDVEVYHAEHGTETKYRSIVNYSENFNKYKLAIRSDEHPVWIEIKKKIISFNPEIVGISVLTPKVPSAFKIAQTCKEINPNIVVIFGNQHPTIKPEEVLRNKNVDFVVRGEGEVTFSELTQKIQDSQWDFHTIPGISFRSNGKIIHNVKREPIRNLDLLPLPARDRLFNFETYSSTQLSMMMTSRGCPYQCGFCASSNIWDNNVRFRSIDNTLSEIKELKNKYSVKNINFLDDSFTIDKNRVTELCRAIIKENLGITWSCLTRINIISDELIKLMKRAGCTKVDIGIESGNQRILDLINKCITIEQIKSAVKILKQNKMFWSGFFMFGFPTETEGEIYDTVNFLKELKPDWANISIFTPYPGTRLYDLSLEKGLITDDPDYTLYSHQNPFLRFTDKIPQEEFFVLANKALKEVYKYNSSCGSLFKRAMTRKYHKNPRLLIQDARKVISWISK